MSGIAACLASPRQYMAWKASSTSQEVTDLITTIPPPASVSTEGFAIRDLGDYWSPSLAMEWNREASAEVDRFAEAIKGRYVAFDLDLGEIGAHDLWLPFVEACCFHRLLSSTFDELNPSGVQVFTERRGGGYWDLTAHEDVFNAVAHEMALSRAMEISALSLPETVPLIRGLTKENKQRAEWGANEVASERSEMICGAIGCISDGMLGNLEMGALLQESSGRVGWLRVTEHPVAPLSRIALDGLKKLPWDTSEVLTDAREKLDKVLNDLYEVAEPDSYQRILYAPGLRFVFLNMLDRFPGYMNYAGIGALLAKGHAATSWVLSSCAFGPMRSLAHGMQQAGGRPYSIHHTGMNLAADASQNRNRGSDIPTLVWGEEDAAYVTAAGTPALPIGSLRRDLHMVREKCIQKSRCQPWRGDILLYPFGNSNVVSATSHPRLCIHTLSRLKQMADGMGDDRLVIRPHPGDDQAPWEEAVTASRGRMVMGRGALDDVVARCDVAVMMGFTTTAALNTIAQGVPNLILTEGMSPFLTPILLNGGAEPHASMEGLIGRINELKSDIRERQALVDQQRAFVVKTIVATGEDAVRNVLELIERDEAPLTSDPALGGLLDAFRIVDAAVSVPRPSIAPRKELIALRRRWRHETMPDLPLDWQKTGRLLLNMLAWGPGGESNRTATQPPRGLRAAWWTYLLWRCMPSDVRPKRDVLHEYILHHLRMNRA